MQLLAHTLRKVSNNKNATRKNTSSEDVLSVTYHVLPLGEDIEERVVPLLNVNVQEPCAWQWAAAGAAHMSVQRVVVVLVLLQSAEDRAAARDVTGELWHTKKRQEEEGGICKKINIYIYIYIFVRIFGCHSCVRWSSTIAITPDIRK